MQQYTKRLIEAFILTLILFGSAQAEMMKISWTGIISQLRPEPVYRYGLDIGDEVSVYAVYDDSKTEMHTYDDSGIIKTYNLDTHPDAVFLSDATISFSDNMHDFIENEYGFTYDYTAWSWVCKLSPTGPIQTFAKLPTVRIDMRSDGPSNGMIINDESSGNIVGFGAGGKNNPIFLSSLTYSVAPYNPDQQPIPEPSTLLLFGFGLLGLVVGSRRQNN